MPTLVSAPVPAPASDGFEVRLSPDGSRFVALPDQTLLQAGLAAGVALPSACRNGTCRACLCRLLQGQLVYTVAWPGLSAEEKSEGWCLPCVAQARSDVVLAQTPSLI